MIQDAAADSAVDRYLLKLAKKTSGGEWPGVPGQGEMRRSAFSSEGIRYKGPETLIPVRQDRETLHGARKLE